MTDPGSDSRQATAGADYPPAPTPAAARSIAAARSVAAPIPDAAVNLGVPFIHQLWDTPDAFNGHWACGPTSATMLLAYYGVLEPHPITVSQPAGEVHESLYGWYVANPFTHNGRTFDTAAATPGRGRAQGIYGAVVGQFCNGNWCAAAWTIQSVLDHFLAERGYSSTFARPSDEAPERMKASLRNGHPLIVSGKLFGWDHLVAVRGYYEDPDADATRWIVNDPYGYRTDGSFDGGNVVYDWDEIRPKWMVWLEGPPVG